MPPTQPADSGKILIGRFGAPFGVQGWLHVVTFGGNTDSFLHNKQWWCAQSRPASMPDEGAWQRMIVENIRAHGGDGLAVKLAGVDGRDEADLWKNGDIGLLRTEFPALPGDDEYYWCDLVGLAAVDEKGEALGRISGLMRTGAHDILRIAPDDDGGEFLVPFIDEYVQRVDIAGGVVYLLWQRDWC